MPTLQFWFEFASTYSYLAASRIQSLAQAADVRVEWKPFLLGPIFRAQGWDDSPFNIYPVKGRYMWRDMERLCEEYGLPLRRPTTFPRNGLLAARVACLIADQAWAGDFVARVYRANFGEDREISQPEVIEQILTELGQAPQSLIGGAHEQSNKDRLKQNTDAAIALGVFGAPSFSAGNELFWGNDRLDDAITWARTRT